MTIIKQMNDYKNIILAEKENMLFIVITMIVVSVSCIRAINTTSIEEIFMNSKNKFMNDLFKLLFILVILFPKNLFLAIDNIYILLGLGALIEAYIEQVVFRKKEERIKKNTRSALKLKRYYKDRQLQITLRRIMYSMPIITILLREMGHYGSLIVCALATSVFEVAILVVSMPELIIKKSTNYYKNGQDRIFIYKSLDNNTFLCGDSEDISDATKYTIKSFNELRKEQILHLKYKKLSKAEIKDLRKELKSNK
ncbi:MAG: hypothetical protein IJD58_08200 [Lachnospiraceae bacterium]|nr:hypothetical protein [Lachnospiraceae bacterium]